MLARSPHPTDGRQVVFSLTEEGARMLAAVRQAKQNWLAGGHRRPADHAGAADPGDAAALIRRLMPE